jgi:hypothetical protein
MFLSFEPQVHKKNKLDDNVCEEFNNKTMAHAYFPSRFDMHINNAKTFTFQRNVVRRLIIDKNRRLRVITSYPILMVLMHEFGHSMGLEHSLEHDSVMLENNVKNYGLTFTDITTLENIWSNAR